MLKIKFFVKNLKAKLEIFNAIVNPVILLFKIFKSIK